VDRCVVLADAGYLLGAAATLLTPTAARTHLAVDHTALIGHLRAQAETGTGRPLLRIYWFDGAPDRVPQPEHRRLRVMPRVTVRLGAFTRSEGRWAQKGVDAAMHAELTGLARNRACSDIVLVTGDGDLLPGLMSAKEHGVAVHLWAVQAADGDYNQSEDLVAEADERRVLDRTWITRAVRARDLTEPQLLTSKLPDRPAPAASARPAEADSGDGLPTLAELTGRERQWRDREDDITDVTGLPHEAGTVFGRRWAERLPAGQTPQILAALRQTRPRIPRTLDGELLRYAARFGLLDGQRTQTGDDHRSAVRAGFWDAIDTAAVEPAVR
jgi:uncharacterized LabA/DUF88 family protein